MCDSKATQPTTKTTEVLAGKSDNMEGESKESREVPIEFECLMKEHQGKNVYYEAGSKTQTVTGYFNDQDIKYGDKRTWTKGKEWQFEIGTMYTVPKGLKGAEWFKDQKIFLEDGEKENTEYGYVITMGNLQGGHGWNADYKRKKNRVGPRSSQT